MEWGGCRHRLYSEGSRALSSIYMYHFTSVINSAPPPPIQQLQAISVVTSKKLSSIKYCKKIMQCNDFTFEIKPTAMQIHLQITQT